MSKIAIVLMYDGAEPSVNALASMTERLRPYVPVDQRVKSFVLGEDDIAKSIVGSIIKDIPTSELGISNEEKAAIYIGERFHDSIKKGSSAFMADLSMNYIFGCIQKNDEPLKKAVVILSEPDSYSKISVATRTKYGLSQSIIEAIREMYHTTCAGHEIVIG